MYTAEILVDPSNPERHREVISVPFQDHVHNGILHNGFGIEVSGADFNLFERNLYRAWLVGPHEVVVQFPTARNALLGRNAQANYDANRARLGGHSETYEVARMVIRNRIRANAEREYYKILLKFPQEYNLTNGVFTPHAAPYGEIQPQITPVLTDALIDQASGNRLHGVEVDIAYRVTIVEEEPRRAMDVQAQNPAAEMLQNALRGMQMP